MGATASGGPEACRKCGSCSVVGEQKGCWCCGQSGSDVERCAHDCDRSQRWESEGVVMEGLEDKLRASSELVSPKTKSKSWNFIVSHGALIHHIKIRYVSFACV